MILLCAFGKKGYAEMAYNLAYSIKKHSDIEITLAIDDCINYLWPEDRKIFDNVHKLTSEDYTTNGRIDPAKLKINLFKIGAEYAKDFLYLDVDALCLQDIRPFFEALKKDGRSYITEVIDKGGKDDEIEYMYWMTNKDAWDVFKLKEDSIFQAIQTSWAFFKNDAKGKSLHKEVVKLFDTTPIDRLKNKWGGTMPDELIYGAALAKKGLDPSFESTPKPIYFGSKLLIDSQQELIDNYILLSVYGNGEGVTLTRPTYLEWYDQLLRRWMKQEGKQHKYKIHSAMRDKHANAKK